MNLFGSYVSLKLNLNFGDTNLNFEFTFELKLTTNSGTNALQDADYIIFSHLFSATPIEIEGSNCYLRVMFVDSNTTNGFSTATHFYAYENGTDIVELKGIITDEIPRPTLDIFDTGMIDFDTKIGHAYQVQISTNQQQTWNDFGSPIIGNNSAVEVFKSIETINNESFRVKVSPILYSPPPLEEEQ